MTTQPLSELLNELRPYRGTRCEIDLTACELILTSHEGVEKRLPLPAAKRSLAPTLQSLGQDVCLISPKGKAQALLNWQPELRYGLMLAEGGPYLLRREDRFERQLVQTLQLIYPGFYPRRQAQGPYDLFVAPDQSLLAVVNRSEACILVIDAKSGNELARQEFTTLIGPKLISVAFDAERRQVWVCGGDDRRLWRWDLASNQAESLSGPWRASSALAVSDGMLWLLDSYQQTFVHGLALPDLKPVHRFSVEGGSFALQTDAPGDLLCLDPDGEWLAVLTQVNVPAPLTPHMSVIFPADRGADHEFQPAGRGWPVLLGTAVPNRALRALHARHALNLELGSARLSGYVKALLQSHQLSFERFSSSLVVLDAEVGAPAELSIELRDLVLERIIEGLRREHRASISLPPATDHELEVVIHAARVYELLKSHEQLDLLLLNLLGEFPLGLQFSRRELLETLERRATDELGKIQIEQLETGPKPVFSWVRGSGLKGLTGLADPLNSRLLQLDDALRVNWSLATTLFGIYRPLDVCWTSPTQFWVLDGDSSRISGWSIHGRQEWALESEDASWSRVLYYEEGARKGLVLVDQQQGRVFHAPECSQEQLSELDGLPDFTPGEAVDACEAEAGSIWLLMRDGRFARYGLDGERFEGAQASGHPTRVAASPDGRTLALFDGQVQKLWLWHDGELIQHGLSVPSSRFRISQPLGMQWRNERELVIHDGFRLLAVEAFGGKLLAHSLLQDLKLQPGQSNRAPESVFAAQAERNLGLLGGAQTSLREMLKRVPLFQDVSRDFLRELVSRVRTQIYNRGDVIVKKGEPGSEMFLIRQGQVEVLDAKNQAAVASMGAGDLFGEVALMLGLPRNATVRAAAYCELSLLRQQDLDALLPHYPEVKERLLSLAQDRSQQEKLRSEAESEQLQSRIQALMAQRRQSLPVTRAASGRVQTEAESKDDLPALSFWAVHPQSGQMARLDRAGKVQTLLGPRQNLVQPVACVETPNGTWVLDMGLNSLLLLDEDRTRLTLERWGEVFLAQPRGLAETPDGALWVANTGRGELLQLSAGGELLQQLSVGRAPASVAVLANGNLLVTDVRQHTVSELSPGGETLWQYGTPRKFGRDENMLFAPEYAERLANGHTLIADTGNSRVLEVDAAGRIVWSMASAAGLRVIRPTRAQRLESGNTLIEHSNHFYWLEISPEQAPVWRYTLPVRGFFHEEKD